MYNKVRGCFVKKYSLFASVCWGLLKFDFVDFYFASVKLVDFKVVKCRLSLYDMTVLSYIRIILL